MSGISIELDYKSNVDSITDNTSTRTEFGTIMDGYCRSFLSSLPKFRISFTHRTPNYVDHFSAREDIIKHTLQNLLLQPSSFSSNITKLRISKSKNTGQNNPQQRVEGSTNNI